jgi:hypothetical protein
MMNEDEEVALPRFILHSSGVIPPSAFEKGRPRLPDGAALWIPVQAVLASGPDVTV